MDRVRHSIRELRELRGSEQEVLRAQEFDRDPITETPPAAIRNPVTIEGSYPTGRASR